MGSGIPDLGLMKRAWELTDDEERRLVLPRGLQHAGSGSHELCLVGGNNDLCQNRLDYLCLHAHAHLVIVVLILFNDLCEGAIRGDGDRGMLTDQRNEPIPKKGSSDECSSCRDCSQPTKKGSPAVAVVDVASPEVHLPSEQSERLPDTAETEVEVGACVEPSAIVPTGARRAIEIASSGSQEAGGEVARVEGEPSKSKKRKRKDRRRGKEKSSSKSGKRSSKQAERRAAKDAAEEEENTKQFQEQVAW
ncbi:hypothetical protein Salat_2605800 [Sesamum alatum]|uniref:Uncharacterized protein n=1 Tax=Sesamum alatum TaxID=300844 RepID=A0AAE1XP32_9LAMI|nr:hypothetical protein Salat_2605800 [Sesamum alatum]